MAGRRSPCGWRPNAMFSARVVLTRNGSWGTKPMFRRRAGTPRPAVVLLNDDDLSYAKVRLDEESQRVVTEHLGDFTRALGIRDRYTLDLSGDPGRTVDRRLAIALGIALNALQSR